MSERMRPMEPPLESPKTNEQKTIERRFAAQVIRSVTGLIDQRPPMVNERLKNLPRSYDLGATLLPTLLFTFMTGCRQKVVDCSPQEDDYIQSTVDWMQENPQKIQEQMDLLWPEQTTSAQSLIDTLSEATIYCGLTKKDSTVAKGRVVRNQIVINVNVEEFKNSLDKFQDGQWTSNYSLEELPWMAASDERSELRFSINDYWYSIAFAAEMLAHESAHLELGKGHNRKTRKEVRRLVKKDQKEDNSGPYIFEEELELKNGLDEIYTWGVAAAYGALATEQDYLDAYNTVIYPEDNQN